MVSIVRRVVVPVEEHSATGRDKRMPVVDGPMHIPSARPPHKPPMEPFCCGLFTHKRAPSFFELMPATDLDRLIRLKAEMHTPYDPTDVVHVKMLFKLWRTGYRGIRPRARMRQWQLLGFESEDPAEDLAAGGGMFALHCMLFFARTEKLLFKDIASRGRGYPWAHTCVVLAHLLKFSLGLSEPDDTPPDFVDGPPSAAVVRSFAHLFIAYRSALERIYVAVVKLTEIYWRCMLKSYVQRRPRRRSSMVGVTPASASASAAAAAAAPVHAVVGMDSSAAINTDAMDVPPPLSTGRDSVPVHIEGRPTLIVGSEASPAQPIHRRGGTPALRRPHGDSDAEDDEEDEDAVAAARARSRTGARPVGAAAATAQTLVAGVDVDADMMQQVDDDDDDLVAQDEMDAMPVEPPSTARSGAESSVGGTQAPGKSEGGFLASMRKSLPQLLGSRLLAKEEVVRHARWHHDAQGDATLIVAGHEPKSRRSVVGIPLEELTAILDFPQVLAAVYNRVDVTLAWLPHDATLEEFERRLLQGASRLRFKRTAILS